MLQCIMSKKGKANVTFTNMGEYTSMTIKGYPEVGMTHENFRQYYRDMVADGWTAKVESPKPEKPEVKKPEKVKKTREEALTERYGDLEHRRAYVEATKIWRKKVNPRQSTEDFRKEVAEMVKYSLQTWEDAGRKMSIKEVCNNFVGYKTV